MDTSLWSVQIAVWEISQVTNIGSDDHGHRCGLSMIGQQYILAKTYKHGSWDFVHICQQGGVAA